MGHKIARASGRTIERLIDRRFRMILVAGRGKRAFECHNVRRRTFEQSKAYLDKEPK